MATKDSFSPQDWILVKRSPYIVSGIVTAADLSMISAMKETKAFVAELMRLKDTHKDNELISSVLGDPDIVSPEKQHDPEMAMVRMLAEIQSVVECVDTVASPVEAKGFKQMLFGLAKTVAEASGEGWFGTGQEVSHKEEAVLERLEQVLGGK